MGNGPFLGFEDEEHFWTDQFEKVAREPITWYLQARDLKRAAEIIFTEHEKGMAAFKSGKKTSQMFKQLSLALPYILLAGFALEILVKGIYVAKDKTIVKNGKLMKWPKTGHDIKELIKLVNKKLNKEKQIKLSEDEENLVQRLSVSIVWAGRYPIPKDSKDRVPSKSGYPLTWKPHDRDVFNMLFQRLVKLLIAERKIMAPYW